MQGHRDGRVCLSSLGQGRPVGSCWRGGEESSGAGGSRGVVGCQGACAGIGEGDRRRRVAGSHGGELRDRTAERASGSCTAGFEGG